jgi:hypothetical protein
MAGIRRRILETKGVHNTTPTHLFFTLDTKSVTNANTIQSSVVVGSKSVCGSNGERTHARRPRLRLDLFAGYVSYACGWVPRPGVSSLGDSLCRVHASICTDSPRRREAWDGYHGARLHGYG